MIWDAGTGVLKLTSYSGLPTDSTITSPDKSALFPYFYDTTTFIISYVPSPSPDTFSLASSAAGFDACGKKEGDDEEEEMI